ncbi:MAG: glycosyltransferase family 9 protein [Proteobacteria bacterium]|nr:glycosyltransferase family 9 protein [Pseudomonadota bacterium]MCH9711356.1 glycosyltransferase family 9 protein [Pseudomonadota bacterium]MCH9749339.1 glycosyltransferase family 9 protein [Pseudomonadota bacterium]
MKLLEKINRFLPLFKKASDLKSFNNVLVVSNSGLGDTILSTPAIVSLRQSFPNLNITFMVHIKMYPLFSRFEYVDDFVLYSSGFLSQIGIVKQLRQKKIDTIFLFHSNGPEDIFFSILSGAKNILKMTDNPSHEFKDIFSNKPNTNIQHDIEKKLDLVKLFNPKETSKRMLVPKYFYKSGNFFDKESGVLYIGIQLGAQDIYKMWPVDNFVKLAKRLNKKFSRIKFVMLGSTKYEQNLTKEFTLKFGQSDLIIDLCGGSSIQELPGILNDLDLLITNDTGTLHLAVALQKQTVSLFGPTDSEVFGPYQDSKLHRVIQVDGFFVNQKPKKLRSQEGMKLIKVDAVFDGVKELLL